MSLAERALRRFNGVIKGEEIDWERWLKPSDTAKIIPAETLAEEGKKRLLLGAAGEIGLTLPWSKFSGKCLVKSGKVAIWTGWSHHGKTAALKQLMLWAIREGEKSLVASMEEEISEVWHDLAIMACGTGEPTPRVIDRYVQYVTGNLWLYDQQGRVEPKRMLALLRYASAELGVTQAVVDSLMMLGVSRDDYEAQAAFVGELKAVAKDTGMTVHLVAHMRKRDGKGGEDQPGGAHDIAGGHEIYSMADYVFNVWRNKAKDQKSPDCVLGIDKQRGRINWLGRFGLDYHEPSRQFTEGQFPMRFWND